MNANTNFLALVVSLGKVLSLIFSFIVPLFLVRILEKSDYGLYSQFNMVFLFLAAFFGFGVRTNLIYFYNNLDIVKVRTALFQTVSIIVFFSIVAINT